MLKGDCHGLRFRLLHAKDDETSHYDRAQSFAGQLTAHGCMVDMVSFDSGGHLITFYSGQTADAERQLKGYFMPVISVNH